MNGKLGWNSKLKPQWKVKNTMPGSWDFVGPRRLLSVFKECQVLELKLSWKQLSKEGNPARQGNFQVPLVTSIALPTSGSTVAPGPHRASKEPTSGSMRESAFEPLQPILNPR